MRDVFEDDRAVSVALNYILLLAVATVLLSGLFIATGNVVDQQSDRVVRNELEVVGQQIAANLMSADRMAQLDEGGDDEIEVRPNVPARAGGSPYTVSTDGDEIVLTADQQDVEVTVGVANETDVRPVEGVNGRDIQIRYDTSGSDPELVIENA